MSKFKIYEFTVPEPNLEVVVTIERFVLKFDENGKLLMGEDNPALGRAMANFSHEVFKEVDMGEEEQHETTVPTVLKCAECEFEAANKSGLSAHIRAKHPKE